MKAFVCTLVILVFGCAASAQVALRPGDTIEIRLSGVPELDSRQFTAAYTIDDQGMLNLPYIPPVRAGGLPPNQVQAAIENKLKADKIFTRPTVTIISQLTSRFVNVGGQVRAPQRIPFTPDLTLMTAINAAGGFTDFADQKRVRFVREGKVTTYDTRKIRKDPLLDPKLQPGDQIEVPQGW